MGKNIENAEKLSNEDALQLLKKDIRQFPLLTPEEVKELIPKIRSGDKEAKEYLINCNLRLVLSIAAKFAQKTEQLKIEDLFQEGCFGLIEAAEKYDPEKGATFSTYATIWIKQTIGIAIKNTALTIRRSANFLEQKYKYYRFVEEYLKKHNKEPDDETVSKILEMSEQTIKLIKEDNNKMPVSLSTPLNDERILERYLSTTKLPSTASAQEIEMSIYLSHYGYQTYEQLYHYLY